MYNFDKVVDRKGTNCIKWDTLKSPDILPMFIADMDFETLPEVTEALVKVANQACYGYTISGDEYFNSIIGWMERRHQWKVEKDWIIQLNGVVPGLNVAVQALTQPGESVIILPPVYFLFKSAILSNGRNCVESELYIEDGIYKIDFEDFEKKIVENNVKLFINCNPHNPGGRVWTKEELTKLAEICLKHNVKIVSDEIHHDIVLKPNKYTPMASLSHEISMNTITCTAPSKTFNLAGLQASNIIIENEEIRKQFEDVLHRFGLHGINMMGIASLIAAYTYGDTWVDEMCEYVKGNMEYVDAYLKENIPQVKLMMAQGTYLAWIDFSELGMDDDELKEFLMEKVKVQVNAGISFGAKGSKYERVNLACRRAIIQEFLERLNREVKKL